MDRYRIRRSFISKNNAIMRWALAAVLLLAMGNVAPGQESWIKDFTRLWERTQPKYGKITFWDPARNETRGVRALLYMVPQDFANRQVDKRLHDRLVDFMNFMCQDIISLESFSDPVQKRMVENVLVQLSNEWKNHGRVNPETLSASLPFLQVDMLVLLERTHYDQAWKGDEKRLLIGIHVGAFELDYGDPLYLDRVMLDVPWFGERASYTKAEHAAMLQVADSIGEGMARAADAINRGHEAEVRAAQVEQKQQAKESVRMERQERKMVSDLVKQAGSSLRDATGPAAVIDPIQSDVKRLRDLLAKKPETLTPQDQAAMQYLAESIQNRMREYEEWKEEQLDAQRAAAASSAQEVKNAKGPLLLPSPMNRDMLTGAFPANSAPASTTVTLPILQLPYNDLLNRSWLLVPRASATPAVSSPTLPMGSEMQSEPMGSATRPFPFVESVPINPGGPIRSQRMIPPPPRIPTNVIQRFAQPQSATAVVSPATTSGTGP